MIYHIQLCRGPSFINFLAILNTQYLQHSTDLQGILGKLLL